MTAGIFLPEGAAGSREPAGEEQSFEGTAEYRGSLGMEFIEFKGTGHQHKTSLDWICRSVSLAWLGGAVLGFPVMLGQPAKGWPEKRPTPRLKQCHPDLTH